MALPNIWKLASNQQISPIDVYEVWIVSRDKTKTKHPKQLGVYLIICSKIQFFKKATETWSYKVMSKLSGNLNFSRFFFKPNSLPYGTERVILK